MIDFTAYLTCAIAVLGGAFRLGLARGRLPVPGTGLLVAFALCLGVSMAVTTPATGTAVEACHALSRSLPLVGDQLKLAAECFLALLAYSVQSPGARRPHLRVQLAGTALVMATSVATYLAGGLSATADTLTAGPGGRAALAAYSALFTAHSCWCTGVFTLVLHRSARHLGPGLLRISLRLVVAGGLLGLLWAVLSVGPLVDGLTLGHEESAEDVVSAPVAALALALGIGGATLTACHGYLTEAARRLRARRDHRRIGPLWAALHAARPEIALQPGTDRRGSHALPRDAEFALYRRVIEIRDGHLALRPYFHPRAAGWAVAAGAGRPADARSAATVEAAVLAAALLVAAAGHEYGADPADAYVPYEVRADLAAETDWLVMVCAEFTGSAVVAEVRRRVRAELAAQQG